MSLIKRLSRVGKEKYQFQFEVFAHEMSPVPGQNEAVFCEIKKKKSGTKTAHRTKFAVAENNLVVWNETLSFVVTMYKPKKSDRFSPKLFSFRVKNEKKSHTSKRSIFLKTAIDLADFTFTTSGTYRTTKFFALAPKEKSMTAESESKTPPTLKLTFSVRWVKDDRDEDSVGGSSSGASSTASSRRGSAVNTFAVVAPSPAGPTGASGPASASLSQVDIPSTIEEVPTPTAVDAGAKPSAKPSFTAALQPSRSLSSNSGGMSPTPPSIPTATQTPTATATIAASTPASPLTIPGSLFSSMGPASPFGSPTPGHHHKGSDSVNTIMTAALQPGSGSSSLSRNSTPGHDRRSPHPVDNSSLNVLTNFHNAGLRGHGHSRSGDFTVGGGSQDFTLSTISEASVKSGAFPGSHNPAKGGAAIPSFSSFGMEDDDSHNRDQQKLTLDDILSANAPGSSHDLDASPKFSGSASASAPSGSKTLPTSPPEHTQEPQRSSWLAQIRERGRRDSKLVEDSNAAGSASITQASPRPKSAKVKPDAIVVSPRDKGSKQGRRGTGGGSANGSPVPAFSSGNNSTSSSPSSSSSNLLKNQKKNFGPELPPGFDNSPGPEKSPRRQGSGLRGLRGILGRDRRSTVDGTVTTSTSSSPSASINKKTSNDQLFGSRTPSEDNLVVPAKKMYGPEPPPDLESKALGGGSLSRNSRDSTPRSGSPERGNPASTLPSGFRFTTSISTAASVGSDVAAQPRRRSTPATPKSVSTVPPPAIGTYLSTIPANPLSPRSPLPPTSANVSPNAPTSSLVAVASDYNVVPTSTSSPPSVQLSLPSGPYSHSPGERLGAATIGGNTVKLTTLLVPDHLVSGSSAPSPSSGQSLPSPGSPAGLPVSIVVSAPESSAPSSSAPVKATATLVFTEVASTVATGPPTLKRPPSFPSSGASSISSRLAAGNSTGGVTVEPVGFVSKSLAESKSLAVLVVSHFFGAHQMSQVTTDLLRFRNSGAQATASAKMMALTAAAKSTDEKVSTTQNTAAPSRIKPPSPRDENEERLAREKERERLKRGKTDVNALRYWNGIPISSCVITRCVVHWQVFTAGRSWALSELLVSLDMAIERAKLLNAELSYLLVSTVMMIHFTNSYATSLGSGAHRTALSVDFDTMRLESEFAIHSALSPMRPSHHKTLSFSVAAVPSPRAPATEDSKQPTNPGEARRRSGSAAVSSGSEPNVEVRALTVTTGHEESASRYEYDGGLPVWQWFVRQLRGSVVKMWELLLHNVRQQVVEIDIGVILEKGESDILGSPTLEGLVKVYDQIFATFKQNNLMPSIRNQFMGALFAHLASRLFNDVLQIRNLCVMNTGFRLQIVSSSLEEWCSNQGGNALKQVLHEQFQIIKQLAHLLLLDKSKMDMKACTDACPSMNVYQLEHVLSMWNGVVANKDSRAPQNLLQSLKNARHEVDSTPGATSPVSAYLSAPLSGPPNMSPSSMGSAASSNRRRGSMLYLDTNSENLDLTIAIGQFVLANVTVPAELISRNPALAFLSDEEDSLTL